MNRSIDDSTVMEVGPANTAGVGYAIATSARERLRPTLELPPVERPCLPVRRAGRARRNRLDERRFLSCKVDLASGRSSRAEHCFKQAWLQAVPIGAQNAFSALLFALRNSSSVVNSFRHRPGCAQGFRTADTLGLRDAGSPYRGHPRSDCAAR